MTTSLPSNVTNILPVERLLPPPTPDSTTLVRLVTEDADDGNKSIAWILNRPHPLTSEAKIVRMFFDRGGVEVYSSDGKMYVRTFIPERRIKFFDEVMEQDVFIEEIAAAEDDEELEPEPEPEPEPAPPAAANGQPAASS